MSEFKHDGECEWVGEEPEACGCRTRSMAKDRDFWKQECAQFESAISSMEINAESGNDWKGDRGIAKYTVARKELIGLFSALESHRKSVAERGGK